MAVSTSISVIDGTTSVLQGIMSQLQATITAFEGVQIASSAAFDAGELDIAQSSLADIEMQMNALKDATDGVEYEQQDYNSALREAEQNADSFKSAIGSAIKTAAGIMSIKKGFDFIKDSVSAADTQIMAEKKLETVMKQRMGANDAMIASVKELASEEQRAGVIGDELQLAGAAQLSTFLNNSAALETLIPAMNDLAAHQNGLENSTSGMVSIGNMMGKVMQGQTSALTRSGITFSEAQKEILKYGTEEERAATLAEVITDNVGQMNEALAATPTGQIQQIQNDFGDMQEVLGQSLYPVIMELMSVVREHLPQIGTMMSALGTAAEKVIEVVCGIIDTFDSLGITADTLITVITAVGTAFLVFKTITTIINLVKFAQLGFNTALLSCPITWIAVGIGALIGLFSYLTNEFGSAEIAWLVLKDSMLTGVEYIQIGFAAMASGIMIAFNDVKLGAYTIGMGIVNYVLGVALDITTIVQDCINGCIDLINGFIEVLNFIPFVEIDTISHVTLSVCDDLQGVINENKEDIAEYADEITKANEDIQNGLGLMIDDIEADRQAREDEINQKIMDNAVTEAGTAPEYNVETPGVIQMNDPNTEETANNTKDIKNKLDVTTEQLKYLRDFAEEQAVDRYTSSNIHIEMTNHNSINSEMDLDGVVNHLRDRVEEEMTRSAKGVH